LDISENPFCSPSTTTCSALEVFSTLMHYTNLHYLTIYLSIYLSIAIPEKKQERKMKMTWCWQNSLVTTVIKTNHCW